MKNITQRVLLICVALSSCGHLNLVEEKSMIREVWEKACVSVCNSDWDTYAACRDHSEKIQLLHSDQGEWLTGWVAIGPKYENMIKSGMKCSFAKNELQLNISESGEMAWGTADVILQLNDSLGTQIPMWQTVVFEKVAGNWKMVLGMAAMPKERAN